MLQQVVYIVPTVLSCFNRNLACVDWILMAQVWVQRWVLVNPVTDLRVPYEWRTSLPDGRKLSSEKKDAIPHNYL
jgi:hypothetical protein